MNRDFMEQLWEQRHYGTPLIIIFTIIPTTAVGLRLYAKSTARQPIELSDYLSITSWAITMGFFLAVLIAVYLPESYLDNADGIDMPVSKITFSLNLLWTGACYCCKLSILSLYYRLLSTPSSAFRLAIKITSALTVCIGVASCLGFLLIFQDITWWWTKALHEHPEAMSNELRMNLAVDIMSLLTDIILFIMPLPVIRKLRLEKNKKRLLIGLFSLGFLTCIEVMIRIITTYGFNGAFNAIQIQCLLMGIEPAMGLTLCSLPVFLRLFRKTNHNQNSQHHPSGQRPNFFPLVAIGTRQSSAKDPEGALLEPARSSTLGKFNPVIIRTDITVHSSHSGYDESLASQDGDWMTS